jgi:hypothetical protein
MKKAGKLLVDLVKLVEIAISPVLRKGLAEFEVAFHFVSFFQVVSQLTTFLDRVLAQLGAKRRVALSLPFFVPERTLPIPIRSRSPFHSDRYEISNFRRI